MGDRRWETEDGRQETGNMRQQTGNDGRWETGDRRQEMGDCSMKYSVGHFGWSRIQSRCEGLAKVL